MRKQILLDQDGVLADFLSSALVELNKAHDRDITLEQYAREFGKWGTYDYYGITVEQFWAAIENNPSFWMDIKPMPWAERLYSMLTLIGDVTIVTTPSDDPDCCRQKLQWLDFYLGIKPSDVFLGRKKYLMAGNGILIDDYIGNTSKFEEAGGKAILIPSTWNTYDVTFEEIWSIIQPQLL